MTLSTNAPVFVESASALVAHVLGEDGLEVAQAPDGVDVTHQSHHHHGWSLNDGHRLHNLTLGELYRQHQKQQGTFSM